MFIKVNNLVVILLRIRKLFVVCILEYFLLNFRNGKSDYVYRYLKIYCY